MCSGMCFTKFSENAEKIYIEILFSVASLEISKPAVSAVAFETCMVSFCMYGWHSLNRLTKASNICSIAVENLRKLVIRSFWFHNPKRIKKHLFLKVQSLLTLGAPVQRVTEILTEQCLVCFPCRYVGAVLGIADESKNNKLTFD